jgi:hypothetical protein
MRQSTCRGGAGKATGEMTKLLTLPLLILAAETPPSCVQQTQKVVPIAATPAPQIEDFSRYSVAELETYQTYCEERIKYSLTRGDNASAQGWAKVRDVVVAEKERRTVAPTPEQPGRKYGHTHGHNRKGRSTRPSQEPASPEHAQPTPEQYPLPPGWPVGPKN